MMVYSWEQRYLHTWAIIFLSKSPVRAWPGPDNGEPAWRADTTLQDVTQAIIALSRRAVQEPISTWQKHLLTHYTHNSDSFGPMRLFEPGCFLTPMLGGGSYGMSIYQVHVNVQCCTSLITVLLKWCGPTTISYEMICGITRAWGSTWYNGCYTVLQHIPSMNHLLS